MSRIADEEREPLLPYVSDVNSPGASAANDAGREQAARTGGVGAAIAAVAPSHISAQARPSSPRTHGDSHLKRAPGSSTIVDGWGGPEKAASGDHGATKPTPRAIAIGRAASTATSAGGLTVLGASGTNNGNRIADGTRHVHPAHVGNQASIEARIRTVRVLIRDNVPVPVKNFLADAVLEQVPLVLRACGTAALYVCLWLCREYRDKAEHDRINRALFNSRANFAEVLGVLCLPRFDTRIRLRKVLTRDFGAPFTASEVGSGQGAIAPARATTWLGSDKIENALTIALESHAITFVADPMVQHCFMEVWNGNLHLDGTAVNQDQVSYLYKLGIPRVQYWTGLTVNILFIALYAYVVILSPRTSAPGPAEVIMYVMVLGFALDDIHSAVSNHRVLDTTSLWNWIDWLVYAIFCVAFIFRLLALVYDHKTTEFNTLAYDLMSINAALLGGRILEWFDTFKAFGYLLIIIKHMLADAAPFFILYAFVFFGFSMAYYGLKEGASLWQIMYLLARAILEDPEFDEANDLHPVFGNALLLMYLVVAYWLLLNLLIAVFNDSYTRIVRTQDAEYLLLFSEDVVESALKRTERPYIPPSNVLGLALMPLDVLVPQRVKPLLEAVHTAILTVFFAPVLIVIQVIDAFNKGDYSWLLGGDDEDEEDEFDEFAVGDDDMNDVDDHTTAAGAGDTITSASQSHGSRALSVCGGESLHDGHTIGTEGGDDDDVAGIDILDHRPHHLRGISNGEEDENDILAVENCVENSVSCVSPRSVFPSATDVCLDGKTNGQLHLSLQENLSACVERPSIVIPVFDADLHSTPPASGTTATPGVPFVPTSGQDSASLGSSHMRHNQGTHARFSGFLENQNAEKYEGDLARTTAAAAYEHHVEFSPSSGGESDFSNTSTGISDGETGVESSSAYSSSRLIRTGHGSLGGGTRRRKAQKGPRMAGHRRIMSSSISSAHQAPLSSSARSTSSLSMSAAATAAAAQRSSAPVRLRRANMVGLYVGTTSGGGGVVPSSHHHPHHQPAGMLTSPRGQPQGQSPSLPYHLARSPRDGDHHHAHHVSLHLPPPPPPHLPAPRLLPEEEESHVVQIMRRLDMRMDRLEMLVTELIRAGATNHGDARRDPAQGDRNLIAVPSSSDVYASEQGSAASTASAMQRESDSIPEMPPSAAS